MAIEILPHGCSYLEPYTGLKYSFLVYANSEEAARGILDDIDLITEYEFAGKNPNGGDQHRMITWAKKSQKGFEGQFARVMHHACFVGHMASRYGDGINAGLLLSDTGILHTMAHMLDLGDDPDIALDRSRDVLVLKISNLESHVPWMWPEDER